MCMNTRNFIHDPDELLREGIGIVNQSGDTKYILRVAMVNFMLQRTATAAELSSLSGIPQRTLSEWVKKVDEEGFEALRAKKQPGKTAKLSESQMAEIKDAIMRPAEESGYYVWDGITLSDYIKTTYGIELGVRQCQRIFKKLGFSRIRPQTYPSLGEDNEQERNEYKKNSTT